MENVNGRRDDGYTVQKQWLEQLSIIEFEKQLTSKQV